jgi:capsular polysaccharide biosynthesis protein
VTPVTNAEEAIQCDALMSHCRRLGEDVLVSLRLGLGDLHAGAAQVVLVGPKSEVRVTGSIDREGDGLLLTFAVPQAKLGGRAMDIAVRASAGDARPTDARLLAAKHRPSALLIGPVPASRMAPPRPPSPPTTETSTTPKAVARRVLRRLRRTRAGSGGGAAVPSPSPSSLADEGRQRRLKVTLLCDADGAGQASKWIETYAGHAVDVIVVGEESPGPSVPSWVRRRRSVEAWPDAFRELLWVEPRDVIVVAANAGPTPPSSPDAAAWVRALLVHLRCPGTCVFDLTVAPASATDRTPESVESFLTDAAGDDLVGTVSVTPDRAVVKTHRQALLQLREDQIGDLLIAREPRAQVSILATIPAESPRYGAARVVDYGEPPAEVWHLTQGPDLTLRHYSGRIVSAGANRLILGTTMLPESFRWPYAAEMRHARSRPVGNGFTFAPRFAGAPILEGTYYYLDCLFSGHFGHLTTEVVCRLWGWERARAEFPDLKALFHTNPARGRDGTLERLLFTSYGIDPAQIVSTDTPVRLRSVVGASPMWHNAAPHWAHPAIRDTWDRMTTGLLKDREAGPYDRIFVSRGSKYAHRRGCTNQSEVEEVFASHGFHVFYPEELPLPEQAALFAGARVVAGFAGSAMFNLMHCRRLDAIVVLGTNTYTARNEHLFAATLGADLHYFWMPALDWDPSSARRPAEVSFNVDLSVYGEQLGAVLDGV